jgi:hypothetical protein
MARMAAPISLDEVFALSPEQYELYWQQIGALVRVLSLEKQMEAWLRIADRIDDAHSKGIPLFRLSALKLLVEADESSGINLLEAAYREDEKFGPASGQLPHRMGAYRLLSLAKEYFQYLRQQTNWQKDLLLPDHRRVLMETLFLVYDRSLIAADDMPSYNYRAFFSLLKDGKLAAFGMENYYCAESLLQMFFLQGQGINKARDEYPLARAIVGLLAGVLEAFLVERLPDLKSPTLGGLLSKAHERGVLKVGTRLSTLSSLMLHLRNYIHADLGSLRTEYFIDINTAKGCKAALDWVIAEMLQQQ